MSKIKELLLMVLMGIISQASPELKRLLHDVIRKLYELAQKSPTPIDDAIVRMLAFVLDVDLTPQHD